MDPSVKIIFLIVLKQCGKLKVFIFANNSDAVDYMTPVCMEDVDHVIREYSIGCLAGCSEESRELFDSVVQQKSLPPISDVNSALQIYEILIKS